MEDPTLNELIRNTELFFEHHWNVDLLGKPPEWSPVHFNFGKIPNYDKQGVYAFIKGDLVTYIGVGTSRGTGRYRGNGLSARVMKYCRWNEDKTEYIAIDPRLKDAGSIITIDFERDTAYLANALEVFLISKIQPVHNVVKVGM